jgi:hypothetical protein
VKGLAAHLQLWLFGLLRGRFWVPVTCHCFEALAAAMWPKCGLSRPKASLLPRLALDGSWSCMRLAPFGAPFDDAFVAEAEVPPEEEGEGLDRRVATWPEASSQLNPRQDDGPVSAIATRGRNIIVEALACRSA